jgi:hypothetical protein
VDCRLSLLLQVATYTFPSLIFYLYLYVFCFLPLLLQPQVSSSVVIDIIAESIVQVLLQMWSPFVRTYSALSAAARATNGHLWSVHHEEEKQQIVQKFLKEVGLIDYVDFSTEDPSTFVPQREGILEVSLFKRRAEGVFIVVDGSYFGHCLDSCQSEI